MSIVFVLYVACPFLCFGPGCYHPTLFSILIPSVGRSGSHARDFFFVVVFVVELCNS